MSECFTDLGYKQQAVLAMMKIRRHYCSEYAISPRREKKKTINHREWSSSLSEEELMLFGDFDLEDAKNRGYYGKKVRPFSNFYEVGDKDQISPISIKVIGDMTKEEADNFCHHQHCVNPTFKERVTAKLVFGDLREVPIILASFKEKKLVDKRCYPNDRVDVEDFKTFIYRGPGVHDVLSKIKKKKKDQKEKPPWI